MKKNNNIAIFASHNASNLEPIYKASLTGELNITIGTIITNNSNANVINKANQLNIPCFIVNSKNTKDVNLRIIEILQDYQCNLIVLAGYMKKISSTLTNNYKIINTHPSLLPKYGGVGMYGKYVHEAVIKNKEKYSGVTVHYVNDDYDDGEIIYQEELILNNNETVQSLGNRIKTLESTAIINALKICLK